MSFEFFPTSAEAETEAEHQLHLAVHAEVAELAEDIAQYSQDGETGDRRQKLLPPLLRLAHIIKYQHAQYWDSYMHSYDRKDENLLTRVREAIAENEHAVDALKEHLIHDPDPGVACAALYILFHTATVVRELDLSETAVLDLLREWFKLPSPDPRRAVATVTIAVVLDRHHLAAEFVKEGL
eukprot:RCo055403